MRECAACQGLFDDDATTCPHDGTALGPSNALLGRVVEGRYRIDGLLGTGGMGSVYRATQLNLDRTVAIKIINAALADRAALDRFKREALVVARLRHPNIVSVYDFGATADVLSAATAVMVPQQAEPLGIRSVPKMLEALTRMRAVNAHLRILGVVLTMVQAKLAESRDSVLALRNLLPPEMVLRTVIPRDDLFIKASARGLPVGAMEGGAPALAVFDKLREEVERNLSGAVAG